MEFERFGPYRLEGLIGRGGMGEVYRAYDTEHDRVVALKVLAEHLATDRDYRERFRREAHAAARLSEPHVVPIHRFGEIDGRLFLDMRLVQGRDLAAAIAADGPLSPRQAVAVIGQVAHALDAAHGAGLVHRDVKPSNVLVCATDEQSEPDDAFVYLVDFGIARSVMDNEGPSLTRVGSAVGSFDYMAPERFLERPLDARSDVYSLACVLFEALTGRRPFPGTDLAPLMWAHINTPPPSVSAVRPEVPAALDEVVQKGLAKAPEDRWPSAGALAAAARRALVSAGVRPATDAPPPVRGTSPGDPVGPRTIGMTGATAVPPTPPGTDPGAAPAFPAAAPQQFAATPPPGGAVPPSRAVPAPAAAPRRSRVPAMLLGLAALLAAALVLVVVLVETSGADALPTPQDPRPGPQHDELVAVVPAGVDREACRPAPPADDGDVAAVDCGPSSSQPGPRATRFFLYPDEETLDAAFSADVERLGLVEFSGGTNCPESQGYGNWTANDQVRGRIACYVDEQNTATLIWTETEFGTQAIVRIRNGGTAGLVSLLDWWNNPDYSDFGG
ncbi:serine/threonine-protein kinase [Geodermatophilus sp. SYSU D00691]